MRRLTHIAITLMLAVSPVGTALAARAWETVRTETVSEHKTIARTSEIEVKAARGIIFVTCNHPLNIKVFNILGRLVSQETLPAGTSQLQLGGHGVYIIKAGEFTCKVAL